MFMQLREKRAQSVAILLLAPLLIGAQSMTGNFEGRLLASHNQERNKLGLKTMSWDQGLAGEAKIWAEHLVKYGKFEHSARKAGQKPQGENIWGGTAAAFPVETMVGFWLAEKEYFKPGRFPVVSKTGRAADVGHYTQIIWRATTKVGCGLGRGDREDILVCRYQVAGNVIGEQPY
ncbi:hypothetical protein MNBD_ALPHA04-1005 [hydrothermal vent metagenome]|uniref:SCP domain-containing protein n=1 Tax=hydrothermal vent metagenome TaxID=652676 RepID=A0A3B0SN67_9ZZZZ